MLPPQIQELHDAYLEEWVKTEEVLKKVERTSNEAYMPSIQELRYAGRRVVQGFREHHAGIALDEIRTHFLEAIENCRKARHDAIDSCIAFVHSEIDALLRNVGKSYLDEIHRFFPNYPTLKKEMRSVNERMVRSRKDRSRLDEEYELMAENHLASIVDFYSELEDSKPLLANYQRRRSRQFWGGVVVVGVVVGILTGLLSSAAVTIADKRGTFDSFAAQPPQNCAPIDKPEPTRNK